jgi:beta-glucosidase
MSDAVTAAPQDRVWLNLRDWLARHEMLLARKDQQRDAHVVFLGDSITQAWLETGKASWERHFASMRPLNLGIGGDETQHILYRLDHGALDGISPKALVLLIGTNNIGNSGMSGLDTADGVIRVVEAIRQKLPQTRILLLKVFPRDHQPGTKFRGEVDALNRRIESLAKDPSVQILDYSSLFLNADGTLPADLFPDGLHLSPAAYERWAVAMRPAIEAIVQDQPTAIASHR